MTVCSTIYIFITPKTVQAIVRSSWVTFPSSKDSKISDTWTFESG